VEGHIDARPLFNWGKYRWFESLIAIYWMYEQTGEDWLLDLAVKLHAQGFNWIDFFRRWPLTRPTPKGKWTYMGHVVNNAMAVKAPALWWRLSAEDRDRAMVKEMIRLQDQYHGQVTGMFTGDECFAGLNPSQGTELCAVMEYLYSLEILLSVTGEAEFGDRLEKIAFNALPATFSPDMWSHQYDQQVNQVECSIKEDRLWTTNGPDSNIYGLEPNFGCCTANLSQGWPKFAAHLWMRSADDGLAAAASQACRSRSRWRQIIPSGRTSPYMCGWRSRCASPCISASPDGRLRRLSLREKNSRGTLRQGRFSGWTGSGPGKPGSCSGFPCVSGPPGAFTTPSGWKGGLWSMR
jgi:hypothetical protein